MLKFKAFLSEKRNMSNTEFNPLQHSDIKKNTARVALFLSKIKDNEEFLTVRNGLVKISKTEYDDFVQGFKTNGFSKLVKTNKGNIQYPGGFLKSGEFGGKGKGSGTRAEDAALKNVQKELMKVLAVEKQPFIKLKIGSRTVECAAIETTDGTGGRAPKSDFTVKDTQGNDVAHISHKDGTRAKDFQQYGGVTDIPDNDEIKKFVEDVIAKHPDGLSSGVTYYRPIKSTEIIMKAIFGINYKMRKVDKNNVDEFHQGNMTFKKVRGSIYEIESSHKGKKGDLPVNGSGYEAVLHARYQGPNGKYGNLVLNHSRLVIFPKGSIPGTSKEI